MGQFSIIVCGQRYDVGQQRHHLRGRSERSAPTRCTAPTSRRRSSRSRRPRAWRGIAARYRPRRLIGGDRSLERLQAGACGSSSSTTTAARTRAPASTCCTTSAGCRCTSSSTTTARSSRRSICVDCAFQAAGVNEISVGVELANRGDALRFPNDYHGKRDKVTCRSTATSSSPTRTRTAQMESMISIGKTLARLFPNLPQVYPPSGGDASRCGPRCAAIVREYAGYLGHYHVTDQKWDPGPFDFKFVRRRRSAGAWSFPSRSARDKPDVPDDAGQGARSRRFVLRE